MKLYKISKIQRKAARVGNDYLEDCKALASEWDAANDRAVFSDIAIKEIKALWSDKQIRPCRNCRGLS